jgi:hypothetical protein
MVAAMSRRHRIRAPEPLGTVLLRSTDARAPVPVDVPPVLPRDWECAVGTKIARRARPTRLERGVLYVRTTSSTWAQELSLLADTIVQKLRERGIEVKTLRFHVGTVEPLKRPAWRTETRLAPEPAALPAEVRASLAVVTDAGLRDAIATAAAVSLGYAERADARTRLPDARKQLPDARERSPDARERLPDTRRQLPDAAKQLPDVAPATSPRSAAPGPRSSARRSALPDQTTPAAPAARRGTSARPSSRGP